MPDIVDRVDFRLQDPPQALIERIAGQGACLLLQGREGVYLLAGHEIAIRGDQQDRRAEGGAQIEQAFGAVGDEHIGCQAKQ
ncbi:hypothetical protein D3C76_1664510 [compost metagenome]